MTDSEILQVAREHQWAGGAEGWTFNRKEDLITFARRIAAMQREIDAGIAEDWDSDSADPREIAAAIREQSDETC